MDRPDKQRLLQKMRDALKAHHAEQRKVWFRYSVYKNANPGASINGYRAGDPVTRIISGRVLAANGHQTNLQEIAARHNDEGKVGRHIRPGDVITIDRKAYEVVGKGFREVYGFRHRDCSENIKKTAGRSLSSDF